MSNHRIAIRISPAMLAELNRRADANERAVSAIASELLADALGCARPNLACGFAKTGPESARQARKKAGKRKKSSRRKV